MMKLSSMVDNWISQANTRQCRGRARCLKPGICFCLCTSYQYEKLMWSYRITEMLRMPLVVLCLQIKLLSLPIVRWYSATSNESHQHLQHTLHFGSLRCLSL